jgi:hypothetical protein
MTLNPLHYIAALLTPMGRLPFAPFLVLGILVHVGSVLLYRHCVALEEPYGFGMGALLMA